MDTPTGQVPPDAIDRLERASAGATAWHDIATDLHRHAESPDDPLHILASAFDYLLQFGRRGSGGRSAAFEPMIRFGSGETLPPLLEHVDPEWIARWEEAAGKVIAAPARARLHDLLSERRNGDVVSHGAAAVSAYLEVATLEGWHSVDRAECLIRALRLARRFKLPDSSGVLERMVTAAEASLRAESPEPGVALRLIEAMAADHECPDVVDELLDVARATYKGAHLTDDIIELQKQRARGHSEQIQRLDRDRVVAWLDEADAATGLVRVVHLETAARLARESGLRDLEEIAQRRLQGIPKDELELQHISGEASIPSEVVDEYLQPFTSAESVDELLVALISHPPATGDVDENRRTLERSRTEFPLQFLFPRVVLGGDHLPRWSPTSDADEEDGDLARQELLHFQVIGDLMARGLWLGAQDRTIDTESIETFIESLPNRVAGVPRRLAGALGSYWAEDWTTACFLAVPCVEALCRSLVLRLGRGIYQTQRGQRPGQYPGLGVLLRWMRDEGLDESWYRYLWTVLASPAGLNLRNEIAHGFALELGPAHAAAVIHMALYLAALDVEERVEEMSPASAH